MPSNDAWHGIGRCRVAPRMNADTHIPLYGSGYVVLTEGPPIMLLKVQLYSI